LTITDFASRYLLGCEALGTAKEMSAFTVFEGAFKEFGAAFIDPPSSGAMNASSDLEEGSHQAAGEKFSAATGEFNHFIGDYNDERPHQSFHGRWAA
jgi:hypothetical protein